MLPEITERVLAEVADARETPLAPETAALIESYVAIKAPAREAAGKIEALQRSSGIDLGPALDAFRRRLDLLEAAGVATSGATFSAEFGRELEYYTGFVFEIRVRQAGTEEPDRRRRTLRQPAWPMSAPRPRCRPWARRSTPSGCWRC